MGLQKTNINEIEEILDEVIEIEKHLHNFEKWFGLASSPNGEIHRADRIAGGINPFQLIAGNNTFGNWVQILGSEDTPVRTGKTKFDFHRLLVTSTNSTNTFVLQIVEGESSEIADKLITENFNEIAYISATNNNDSGISDIIDLRFDSGSKVWMRCCCIGANGVNINFYIGIHEYDE